jgi:hypothetical protein
VIQGRQEINRKLKILEYAKNIGDVSKTCRFFLVCPGRVYKGTSSYSIIQPRATRRPLFHKDRSWPKAIFRGAL